MSHGLRQPSTERVYVKVNADFDETGYMQPRAILWADGRMFKIDQIRDFHPDHGSGSHGLDRYTVIIRGKEKFLFFERTDPRFVSRVGRWFIERPVAQ